MTDMILAADIGMTNIDLAHQTPTGVALKMLANPAWTRRGSCDWRFKRRVSWTLAHKSV